VISYSEAIHNSWLPVCAVKELGTKPLRRLLHGQPLVIFNGRNGPAILRDRCPHRNVPLSNGHVEDGAIVCPYHGWAFEADGVCSKLPGSEPNERLCAEAMPVKVANGLVFTNAGTAPRDFVPLPFPINDDSYDHHVWPTKYRGSLIDGMENLLDPAHPHYMHPRIVGRSRERVRVEVERREYENSVECTYNESERRRGWLPALLEGQRLKGVGRFFGPTTCQLAFLGKTGPRLFITAIYSPQTRDDIQAIAIFSTPKGRLPAWLKGLAMVYFHDQIIQQDQAMIKAQLENLQAFGGPKYKQGPMDFIKPAMVKLMNGESLTLAETRFTCWL
jgi:phenylpropionate dioxygenase-like ring-hydroxylating dioxygenase large terminal subunit